MGAYDDFIHTVDAHLDFSPERTGRGLELITGENNNDLSKIIRAESAKSTALLKASYLFAVVYMEMILGTINNQPTISFSKFLNSEPNSPFDISALTKAYSIAIYRNKLLAHHDKMRFAGSMSKIGIGEVRIQPMGHPVNLSVSERKTIVGLKEKYKWHLDKVPHADTFNVPIELVTELFYFVPAEYNMKKGHDRIIINNLAESVGVRSLCAQELLEAVDSLTENAFNWHARP